MAVFLLKITGSYGVLLIQCIRHGIRHRSSSALRSSSPTDESFKLWMMLALRDCIADQAKGIGGTVSDFPILPAALAN